MCVEDKYLWQWTKQHQKITDGTESHDKKLKQKNANCQRISFQLLPSAWQERVYV